MSIHDLALTFISSLLALFPVLNPIGSGFIINNYIGKLDHRQHKIVVKRIAINCIAIALVTLIAGHFILILFGLAIPIIQVGGGILICKTGWEWLSEKGNSQEIQTENYAKKEMHEIKNKHNTDDIEKKLFYPMSFPITIDAGTISVIFTLMATTEVEDNLLYTGINYSVIAVAIICLIGVLFLFLSQGSKLLKKMDETEYTVINKLIAFITFCIGIQIIIKGISKIFHITVL